MLAMPRLPAVMATLWPGRTFSPRSRPASCTADLRRHVFHAGRRKSLPHAENLGKSNFFALLHRGRSGHPDAASAEGKVTRWEKKCYAKA